MATPRRRTFSGAMGASLLGATLAIGWVPASASQATAIDTTFVAADACPVTWPALRPGPPGADMFDGNVSVLVGGDLTVTGRAAGAEGVVVARGSATFARDEPGPYRVGVTDTGSQVTPHPGSDMLVVGGDLATGPGTSLAVGPALDGDVAVGGSAEGASTDLGAGRLDAAVADAMAPYDALVADLGARSGAYAGRPVTGSVEVTGTAITLVGDGVSDLQVFAVDGAALGTADNGAGRTLQVLGVPDGASVVVNLTGDVAALAVDAVLTPGGGTVDPAVDGYFADLATHLLWNVPDASLVGVGGSAQLPGSLLVGAAGSTTTLAGAGTNGRVWVGGHLVHTGAGELHSYPFLRDQDLSCGPDLAHRGTLTLDVVLKDPGNVVDPERYFEGTFACFLDGIDVTPGDGTWQLRAQAEDRLLSDRVPVGAQCFVDQQLKVGPGPGWDWAAPDIAPARVKVAKRDPRGFTVTNSVQQVRTPPEPDPEPTPDTSDTTDDTPTTTTPDPVTPDPVETPPTLPEHDPVLPEVDGGDSDGDVDLVRPSPPVQQPDVPVEADDADEPVEAAAEPAPRADSPGPLTTTAPYSLRGTFVWAPLLLLSVLALRLRFPWRYKRRRRLY